VRPRQAWFKGDASFIPNTANGMQRQEQDCRELAKRRGWQVVDVYSDDDASGASGRGGCAGAGPA
jgi:DNA invertase Pin-like site-specific DNA recombinase